MSANYYNEAQALYLGLFDSVANSSGQAYWEGEMQNNLNGALASLSTYAPITATNTATQEVTNIYENLLGYTPANIGSQSNGVAYWANLAAENAINPNNGMNIAQVVNSIYNIVENISSSSPLYINTETMNARIYAANSFTADYAANVISSANLSYAAAGNYVTTGSGLTQSGITSNPMAPYSDYSPTGIQSAMTTAAGTPQTIDINAAQASYAAQLTSQASPVTFVVNDTGSYNSGNANGTATANPPIPSVLSPHDSLNASGGNGTLEINAFVTIAGTDPALNTSGQWGWNYFGLLPSSMTGIQTIEINNQSMAVNTSKGAAALVPNIIINNPVSDAFNNQTSIASNGATIHYGFTDPYFITSTQNFTYEFTGGSPNYGAIIDSTGTSANVTLDNVTASGNIIAINGISETQTINIMGSAMALNLTSAGTNDISLTNYGPVTLPFGTLTAAPLTTLNIGGDSANTLTIADNTTSGIANINASSDAGTLNLTTNANIINTTITVGSGVDTITTSAIYDTMNASTNVNTTPQNFITIAGSINAIASDFLSFAGTPTINSFSAAAASTGYNASNSVGANVTDIISALQTADKGIIADNAVYFYEGGNTYIVNDSNTFTGGANTYTDQVVQLTGTVSLAATSTAAGAVHI
ncbi:MAG: beta strand repeat-containing protein [bacterium]